MRRRLFIAAAAVLVASIVAGVFYDQVFAFLSEPFNDYRRANPQSTISLNFGEATSALSNLISLSIFVGVVASSPVWLYQAWAFVVPGLTRKEKRISLAFVGSVVPLFLLGCWLGYAILPKSLAILYGFSPEGTSNIQQVSMYFSFVTRFILVFGRASSFRSCSSRSTSSGPCRPAGSSAAGGWRSCSSSSSPPSPRPRQTPSRCSSSPRRSSLLYFAAYFVCRILDKRKAAARPDWLDVDDTEASAL